MLRALVGRLGSLTLSPPGEIWAKGSSLQVTETYCLAAPRLLGHGVALEVRLGRPHTP